MSGLHVDVEIPERDVIASFDVAAGEVTAILGPNGAGKSTVLAAVAGLHHPNRGRIELNGRVLTDTAAGVCVSPHKRGTVLLAQDALLFPHLSAVDNVAFAPRSAGRSRRESAQAARPRLPPPPWRGHWRLSLNYCSSTNRCQHSTYRRPRRCVPCCDECCEPVTAQPFW